jgi:hypothetical protein
MHYISNYSNPYLLLLHAGPQINDRKAVLLEEDMDGWMFGMRFSTDLYLEI